jgi:hypothetical protein
MTQFALRWAQPPAMPADCVQITIRSPPKPQAGSSRSNAVRRTPGRECGLTTAANHQLLRQICIGVAIGGLFLSEPRFGSGLGFSPRVRDGPDTNLGFRSRHPSRRWAPRRRAIIRFGPRTVPRGGNSGHGNIASAARCAATGKRAGGEDENNESGEHHGSEPRKVWLPRDYPGCIGFPGPDVSKV